MRKFLHLIAPLLFALMGILMIWIGAYCISEGYKIKPKKVIKHTTSYTKTPSND